jgi:TQXA domain-containing protein
VVSVDFACDRKIPIGEGKSLFAGFESLQSVSHGGNMDISGNCYSMFDNCGSMTACDLAGLDTSRVTDMSEMFWRCWVLPQVDVFSFDTSRVTSMSSMFAWCPKLKSLDLSNFDTSSLTVNGTLNLAQGDTSLEYINLAGKFSGDPYGLWGGLESCSSLKTLVLGPLTGSRSRNMNLSQWALDGQWAPAQEATLDNALSGFKLGQTYNRTTMAGTWVRVDDSATGHYYRSNETLGQDNLWESHYPDDKFKGYCINLNYHGVGKYLDRVDANNEMDLVSFLCEAGLGSVHGSEPLASTMRDALITLIYYGWPNDGAGIQKQYGLTDDQYMEVTQQAIWDFTDRYDKKAGPTAFKGASLEAYNALVGQRFANIPGQYKLYIYHSQMANRQNLLSIQGLSDGIYGGVEVVKQDEKGQPLQGAVFTVYDSQGHEAGTMTSRESGKASLCRTDTTAGLAAGTYTVKETTAPKGYDLTDTVYTFTITEDNQIVTLGSKDGGPQEAMIFSDGQDQNYKGAGLMILKQSPSGAALEGAVFTVTDQDGQVAASIATNEAGIARTGIRGPGPRYLHRARDPGPGRLCLE